MTVALAPNQLNRLRKLCGMLGSAHAGERAAAALKASELLAANKLSWGELLQVPAVVAPVAADRGPRTWRVVAGLLERGRAPSPKQSAWLAKICRRCGVPMWAGCA
jgi:hypothetical protein